MKKKAAMKSRTVAFQFTIGKVNADSYTVYAAAAMHALLLRGANFYGSGGEEVVWPEVVADMAHRFAQEMFERAPDVSTKVTRRELAKPRKVGKG